MKTIHLFFNGREANFPESNDWEKMGSFDTVRLFLACAESWQRWGWEVKRLTTGPVFDISSDTQAVDYTPLKFSGRIAKEGNWFPADNWQLMAKAATLQPNDQGEIWIASLDVFNWRFIPSRESQFKLEHTATGCVSFQKEHFSLSCFCATPEWFAAACVILLDYDSGKLPRIPGKYTSDETILRTYAKHVVRPLQCFAGDANASDFPLVHYARPLIPRVYQTIPTT